jgi:hypothetical protein
VVAQSVAVALKRNLATKIVGKQLASAWFEGVEVPVLWKECSDMFGYRHSRGADMNNNNNIEARTCSSSMRKISVSA